MIPMKDNQNVNNTNMRPTGLRADESIDTRLDIDINALIDSVLRHRQESPVVRTASVTELQAAIPQAMPEAGMDLDDVVNEVKAVVETYMRKNSHPGFYGYIASPALATDPASHALTAALNQNVVGYPGAPGAATIERTVIRWMTELMGYPSTADGVFLSGGSMANFSALAAALYDSLGVDAINDGLSLESEKGRPMIFAAYSVHFSIQRAAVLLGIGKNSVKTIATDQSFCLQATELDKALTESKKNGELPFCVVATAGSTTTGTIDPIDEIANVCQQHDVWLHVDAAYGAAAMMSKELRPQFSGIEKSDSIAMDLHKWFYMAFAGSILLYKNPASARQVFFQQSDYVQFPKEGTPEQHMFFHLSPELSRRFRALPAYIALRYYGIERLGRNVYHNFECARYLAALVKDHENLKLLNEPALSICCFRFIDSTLTSEQTDMVNTTIRQQLEQEGDFYLSATDMDDRPVLRVCICSHTTRPQHMEDLVDAVVRVGQKLIGEISIA